MLDQTPASGTPGKPAWLSATPRSTNGGRASLDWPRPSGTPTGYQVLVEYSSGEGVNRIIITRGSGSSYAHATLREGTRRTFRVRGVNANGAGHWSEPTVFVADREDDSYPRMPKGFTAYQSSERRIDLKWQPTDDATVTGYRIVRANCCARMSDYRGFPIEGAFTVEATLRNTIATETADFTFQVDTEYRYAVQWIKAGATASEDVYSALSFIYRIKTNPNP